MKKQSFITILLIVLMSMTGAKAFAHDIEVVNSDGKTIYYKWINKTELAVSDYDPNDNAPTGAGYSGEIIIPESVEYGGKTFKVTAIRNDAFYLCMALTSVTIPNSVTSIGEYAFANCVRMNSITIPNSVTSIDGHAFNATAWYNNQPDGLVYAGKVAYKYKGEMPANTQITLIDGTLGISENAFRDCSNLTSITIPNSVTSIGNGAFNGTGWYNNQPDGLVYAGKVVYKYKGEMPANSHITIKDGTQGIASFAFSSCKGLTSVSIPNSVESIGSGAFTFCSGLTSVTIPNSVESIGDIAFDGCNGLASIKVESGNQMYDSRNNCNAIIAKSSNTLIAGCKNTIIPNNVTSIGGHAFDGCTGLTSITIPDKVEFIGGYAFDGCNGLASITIPDKVEFIGAYAFSGCKGLTSVVSEIENPFAIDNSVFNGISSNATLIVPKGTKAAYQATKGWNRFTNIVEAGEIGQVFSIDGISYKIGENNTVTITSARNSSGNVVIPNEVTFFDTKYSVTSIGDEAFWGCSGLTSITIPNSVTSIGNSAFYECETLPSVTIPNSVTSIGEDAFRFCSGLHSVVIGSGVKSIGFHAFSYTNIKKTIWLTNTPPSGYSYASGTVNYVSNDQFNISNQVVYKYLSSYFDVGGIRYVPVSPSDRTCDAIDCIYDESAENINIGETVTNKGITLTVMKVNPYTCCGNKHIKDVKLSLVGDIGDYAFYGSILETAELGQNVTSIGGYAFSRCSKLKSIVIPDAVKSIGSYAFWRCSSMTSAKIGNGIETIDECAFSDCSLLTEINIGSKVNTINNYAFSGCSALPSITIPQAVTTIGNNVFYNCTSLAKVTIADSESTLTLGSNGSSAIFSSCPLDYVYIGRNINYSTSSNYGYSPFYRNTSLRAVKITDKETEISENEFYGCTNLQQMEIGDGVTTIGNWAFSGCSSLKYFAFGSKVTNIGQEAFSDCTAVTEITSLATTPPACGSQALDDINKWECKLFVPKGCQAIYGNAEQWKDFFYMEEGVGTLLQAIVGDANGDGKVNAADIVEMVNAKNGKASAIFNLQNADMDGNNEINQADIDAVVSIIMSQE